MDDIDEMVNAAQVVAQWRLPRARSVAVVTNSGGTAALAADELGDSDIKIVESMEISAENDLMTDRWIAAGGERGVAIADLGKRRSGGEFDAAREVLHCLAERRDVGVAIIAVGPTVDLTSWGQVIVEAVSSSSMPIVVAVLPGSAADGLRRLLSASGIVFMDSLSGAIRVAKGILDGIDHEVGDDEGVTAQKDVRSEWETSGQIQAAEIVDPILERFKRWMPPERKVSDHEGSIAATKELGYPLVIKATDIPVAHRGVAGLVEVGVRSERRAAASHRDHWPACDRHRRIEFAQFYNPNRRGSRPRTSGWSGWIRLRGRHCGRNQEASSRKSMTAWLSVSLPIRWKKRRRLPSRHCDWLQPTSG